MKDVQTYDDVYPALDELAVELKRAGELRPAATLHHRMHQVAWTVRSQLFEELQSVLTKALESEAALPQSLKEQTERVLRVIRSFLDPAEKRRRCPASGVQESARLAQLRPALSRHQQARARGYWS